MPLPLTSFTSSPGRAAASTAVAGTTIYTTYRFVNKGLKPIETMSRVERNLATRQSVSLKQIDKLRAVVQINEATINGNLTVAAAEKELRSIGAGKLSIEVKRQAERAADERQLQRSKKSLALKRDKKALKEEENREKMEGPGSSKPKPPVASISLSDTSKNIKKSFSSSRRSRPPHEIASFANQNFDMEQSDEQEGYTNQEGSVSIPPGIDPAMPEPSWSSFDTLSVIGLLGFSFLAGAVSYFYQSPDTRLKKFIYNNFASSSEKLIDVNKEVYNQLLITNQSLEQVEKFLKKPEQNQEELILILKEINKKL